MFGELIQTNREIGGYGNIDIEFLYFDKVDIHSTFIQTLHIVMETLECQERLKSKGHQNISNIKQFMVRQLE